MYIYICLCNTMMYYDALTIYRSYIQRKSSRTPLTACGCGFASPWAIGHTNPGMRNTSQPRSWWELLHLGFTGFQVPLALLCLFRTQICCASDQTATHNCDHSDKDPIVNPGGRLLSHSDTFANTAALAISRWQYGNNLHKLDIACLHLWRTTTT